MGNIVLVHGAWHGGWCYRDTAKALRAMGHDVFSPTHTGVGERFHASQESITLETHIRDVVGCIEAEEVRDVLLCGHSYGGMVITAVADRLPDRISTLAYLDAFVPQHGDSLIGLINKALPPETAVQRVGAWRGAALQGNSGMMQPPSAEMFGVAEQHRAWVDRRCVPQPLATFEMPLLLSGAPDRVRKRLYIHAEGMSPSPFRYFADLYQDAPGWEVIKMPCGHDIMVDMPNELATVLARLA